jgi:hypothetical protein
MTPLPRPGRARAGAAGGASGAPEYDEYRVKLYKVACRAAQDERERQLEEYEARLRERA